MVHGFRKFFKTMAETRMSPANVEILLNHDIGVSSSYYKPIEQQLLKDYLQAIDLLTINEENRLSNKIGELEDRNKDNEYIINRKLRIKEEEIESLRKQGQIHEEAVTVLSDKISDLVNQLGSLRKQIKP
jgi:uncharacterized coiled-coil DUF342 family protein